MTKNILILGAGNAQIDAIEYLSTSGEMAYVYKDKPDDTGISLMDCARAEQELGFSAIFSVKEAVKDIFINEAER